MDLNQLNGKQLAILERAILAAFTRAELDRLLVHGDRETLETLVANGSFEEQVSALLGTAKRKGWTDWLISAIREQRPNNPTVKRLRDDLKAAAATSDDSLDDTESAEERRHRELLAKQDEILAAVQREKGVPIDQLVPVLERLGHSDVPISDIPRLLGETVDTLAARAGKTVVAHNDGVAIDEAIYAAREKLASFDVSGALATLDTALDNDDAYARAIAAQQEAQAHRVQMGKARARAYFEKAFIQRTTLDHDGSIKNIQQGLEFDPDATWQWIALGDEFVATGKLSSARTAFEAAGGAAERQGDERDLSVSFNKIGDVQVAQGDLAAALKSYRADLGIAERLAASDPGNAEWQRDLSVSFDKIGDVQVAQGDLAAALKSYRDGLAIRERLAASDPGNAGWQRDLSVSFNKIGDVQVAQGDLAAALKSYRDTLGIAERLAASDPGNAGWQRDLSVSFNRIGDVLVAQGDLAAALKSYRHGLGIAERLAASDPGNAGWQHDLSVSFEKIGDVQVAQGDLGTALKSYHDSLAIRGRWAAVDPGNAGWQRDLSVSFSKIGDVQVAQGDLAAALKSYRVGLPIRERLAASDPGNAGWQRDLIVSLVKIAQSSPNDAPVMLGRALAIAHQLKDSERLAPRDDWMLNDLARRLAELDTLPTKQ